MKSAQYPDAISLMRVAQADVRCSTYIDVLVCPQCGGKHERLNFLKVDSRPCHVASCPVHGGEIEAKFEALLV